MSVHVVLGFLGVVVTILVLLHRLAEAGISLGGLNPFLWRRRRAWRQRYEANPVFAIRDPMELVALLALQTAKADGDLTGVERQALLEEFTATFSLPDRKAEELLAATSHMQGDGSVLQQQLSDIVRPCVEHFSDAQVRSMMAILERIASADGDPTPNQRAFVGRVEEEFAAGRRAVSTWQPDR